LPKTILSLFLFAAATAAASTAFMETISEMAVQIQGQHALFGDALSHSSLTPAEIDDVARAWLAFLNTMLGSMSIQQTGNMLAVMMRLGIMIHAGIETTTTTADLASIGTTIIPSQPAPGSPEDLSLFLQTIPDLAVTSDGGQRRSARLQQRRQQHGKKKKKKKGGCVRACACSYGVVC
jgi:hypothetical protein